jgi:DNA-directed RNA polymerase I subunit RPA1
VSIGVASLSCSLLSFTFYSREEGPEGSKSDDSSSSSSSDNDEEASRRGGAAKASYGMGHEVEGETDDEDDSEAGVEAVVVAGHGGEAAGSELAMKFSFDGKLRQASLSFSVPAASKKLLMLEVLSKVSAGVILREVPGIRSSFVIENTGEPVKVMTEGVNLSVIPAMSSMVEVNKLRSSDIWAMMQAYGVEAGRACIVEEIGNVFASYGISVNSRHLTLIADYMTFDGTFRPMNRLGMDWGEPLQRHFEETELKALLSQEHRHCSR